MSLDFGSLIRPTLRRPNARTRHPLLVALRGAWTLPTNLLGHAVGVLASGGSRGEPVESPYARARVYVIREPLDKAVGGLALGHAILLARRHRRGLSGRVVLAHELAHTRQHDVLGPLYLPLHVSAQLVSALLWLRRPVPGSTPVHAYNPLEQRFLFLGASAIDPVLRGERMNRAALESLLVSLSI